jgi:hypothetical protein
VPKISDWARARRETYPLTLVEEMNLSSLIGGALFTLYATLPAQALLRLGKL